MALLETPLYSQLVRAFRDILPIGRPAAVAGVSDGPVLTSTDGSTIPPLAPTDLPYLPRDIRPTILEAKLHPRTREIVTECHAFFLEHWPFPSDKHRKRFCDEGYAWFNCILCPDGLDDRMVGVCKFLTTGFLIDDMLDRMSVEDGKAHNAVVIACSRGERLPDRKKPAQWIMYDLFEEFREIDKELADMLLGYTIDFFEAQTDADRSKPKSLKDYFEYRHADLGKGFMSGVMCFSMGLHMKPEELALVQPLEMNVMRHVTLVNDIASYEKEVLAAGKGFALGQLCSAVPIVMTACGVNELSAMRIMWEMSRELEKQHFVLLEEAMKQCNSESMRLYAKGLEFQAAGNERWNLLTPRYNRSGGLPFAEGRIWG
ncbi:aristolochene synthase [Paraphaeosphaeria sporulosa]